MYSEPSQHYYVNGLGDTEQLGDGVGQQIGGMAASFVVKTGTTMAITSLTSGAAAGGIAASIGAMAGPIGAIIGFVISFIISLFGPDPKVPIFGVTIVVPQDEKPTVGKLLDLLRKPIFDFKSLFGYTKLQQDQIYSTLVSRLSAEPEGSIFITSGGLPEAYEQAKQLDYSAVTNKTAMIAAPFIEVVNMITDPIIKASILSAPLSFTQASSYYFNFDKQNNPRALYIKDTWDQYKVSGNEELKKALQKGFEKMATELNKQFIQYVGVDINNSGTVVNGTLATQAFKPPANPLSNITQTVSETVAQLTSTPGGLAILGLGAVMLLSRE